MSEKIRVDNEDMDRFEVWLSERFKNGVDTGRLRIDDNWPEKFKYLLNRCIDAERKLVVLANELNEERRHNGVLNGVVAEKEEKLGRQGDLVENMRAKIKELENEKVKGLWDFENKGGI